MTVSENQLASLLCLIVEDTLPCRTLLAATLKAIGVKQVLTASCGSEAVDILTKAKRPIDVVLSDIRMPNGSGLQLLQTLRTGLIKFMRVDATFVLTTAYPTTESVKVASSLDANGYLVKPITPEKMQAAILKARRTVFPSSPARYAQVTVAAEL